MKSTSKYEINNIWIYSQIRLLSAILVVGSSIPHSKKIISIMEEQKPSISNTWKKNYDADSVFENGK